MPGGNKKGPLGLGPMTGRGDGYCGGSETPGSTDSSGQGLANRSRGRGGRCRGGGQGGRGRGGNRARFGPPNRTDQQPEVTADSAAAVADAHEDTQQQDLTALRNLVSQLAQSVQKLEGRLQQRDEASE